LDASAGPARFFLGARHSHTGQARQFFSPSAGLTAGRGAWRGRVSAYRSFRAPTLNELYRDFRQGNAVTQANDRLKPERLTGVEAGADYFGEAFRVSVTAFQNSLRDLVANVTLVATPQQIIRQRRNAGAGTAKGMEADFRYRWRGLATELSYLYSDSRFDTGFRTPQIPKHQGSAQLSWHVGQTWLAAGVRSTSYQFDDDINRFRLPGFAAVHLSVQRRLKRSLSAVVVYENLLNREYYTAFTPVPAIAGPRLWRAGLRWDGPLLRARR
jgi:outer membrane receptor protein involved in Fe transport